MTRGGAEMDVHAHDDKLQSSSDAQILRAAKVKNHRALIEATLKTLAELGYANASVSEIIKRAGLSRGMIHLHFGSKNKLVSEAAKHASERYHAFLEHCLERAGPRAQDQLEAIVKHDLSEDVLNATSVRVWYELRGAIYFQNELASYSDTRDDRLRCILFSLFRDLSLRYGDEDTSERKGRGRHLCLSRLNGRHVERLLASPRQLSARQSKAIGISHSKNAVSDHFDLEGAKPA